MAKALRGDKSALDAPNHQKFIPTLVINKGSVEEFSTKLAELKTRAEQTAQSLAE